MWRWFDFLRRLVNRPRHRWQVVPAWRRYAGPVGMIMATVLVVAVLHTIATRRPAEPVAIDEPTLVVADLDQAPAAETVPASDPEPGTDLAGADRDLTPASAPALSAGMTPVPGAPLEVPTAAPAADSRPVARTVTVLRGDTLLSVLAKAGIETGDAAAAVTALNEVADADRLQIGQTVQLTVRDVDGVTELLRLALASAPGGTITVTRDNDGSYSATSTVPARRRRVELIDRAIAGSLYDTGIAAGLSPATLAVLARAFAHRLDLQRDLSTDDRLTVLLDQPLGPDGRQVAGTQALYAALSGQRRRLVLVRYQPRDRSQPEYFTEQGAPARQALLRTPLDGARISSGFGLRRHPILGYTRLHRGLDFAAPTGTPVFAAGDGVVSEFGPRGGYGQYLRLRHDSVWDTAYAHLDHFARGLKPGSRVHQGQVIGYVGSTGRSTGPHLHFELVKDGTQIDPKTVAATGTGTLTGTDRTAFLAHLARLRERIEGLREGVPQS